MSVWDGTRLQPGLLPSRLINDFFIFEPSLVNGAYITAGDLNGDGKADIIAGGGPSGGPRVFAVDAATLLASDGTRLQPFASFFAGDPNNRDGARVSVKDLDGDPFADLVVAASTGTGPVVFTYLGVSIVANDSLQPFFGPEQVPGLFSGVFVGESRLVKTDGSARWGILQQNRLGSGQPTIQGDGFLCSKDKRPNST